jgi:putative addiction module component (TIGR02574 family)
MSTVAVDINQLSRDQQLDLLDQLWERLGRDPQALPLNDTQQQELDRRLDALEADGPVGIPWDEVVAHIRARRR